MGKRGPVPVADNSALASDKSAAMSQTPQPCLLEEIWYQPASWSTDQKRGRCTRAGSSICSLPPSSKLLCTAVTEDWPSLSISGNSPGRRYMSALFVLLMLRASYVPRLYPLDPTTPCGTRYTHVNKHVTQRSKRQKKKKNGTVIFVVVENRGL